jgi:hypothetical protein
MIKVNSNAYSSVKIMNNVNRSTTHQAINYAV